MNDASDLPRDTFVETLAANEKVAFLSAKAIKRHGEKLAAIEFSPPSQIHSPTTLGLADLNSAYAALAP